MRACLKAGRKSAAAAAAAAAAAGNSISPEVNQ